MTLNQLVAALDVSQVWGDEQLSVHQIEFDSRKVEAQSLFVAVRGTQADGHQYIDKALASEAVAIVAERAPTAEEKAACKAWVKVPNSAAALAYLASAFYGHPSKQLKLIGITGTNGKTTTATILYQLFHALGYKTGLLSTVENRVGDEVIQASHTTPDAVQINKLLADMQARACEYVFMEVSSHAVDQDRIAGLHFAGGVFTNISKDHIEYHGSMKAYINAKKKFFDNLPKEAFALVNVDDKRGLVMLQNTAAHKHTYSALSMADYRVKLIENTAQGLHLEMDNQQLFARLIGAFNAYNLLAAYGTAMLLGQDKAEVLTELSGLKGAAGRATYVQDPKGEITAVVDYAHTTDALDKICRTMKELLPNGAKLYTVFGCGGDRDKAKRPLMTQAACQSSDMVIMTSDNVRTEKLDDILDDMAAGIPEGMEAKVLRINDRKSAILTACQLAKAGDIVLVAGKGHENYQEVNGVKHHFDDTEVLNAFLTQTKRPA